MHLGKPAEDDVTEARSTLAEQDERTLDDRPLRLAEINGLLSIGENGILVGGGRWNEAGVPVVYAADSRSLACLETLVHTNASGLPLNRYLVEITVPRSVWSAKTRQGPASLPVGWDARPPSRTSIKFGTAWLLSRCTLILVVPSVIVPEEQNILINPLHPAISVVTARKIRLWLYDPRLKSP